MPQPLRLLLTLTQLTVGYNAKIIVSHCFFSVFLAVSGIGAFPSSKFPSMSTFNCRLCNFTTTLLHTFLKHAKSHRNVANFWYACGVPNCPCSFKKFQSLKSHMYRHHHAKAQSQASALPQDVEMSCQVAGCTFHCADFSSQCAHLRRHIADGRVVNCPYTVCTKKFGIRSSFSSHLSRYLVCSP